MTLLMLPRFILRTPNGVELSGGYCCRCGGLVRSVRKLSKPA